MAMYESAAEIDVFFKCLFQYRPIRRLGEGAFGLAFLVFDEVEKVKKVFKFPKDESTTEALHREGENLVKLSELAHANIIRLHQYGKVRMTWNGVEQDRYYLNMAYGGIALREKVGKLRFTRDENGNSFYFGSGRRLSLEESLRIAIDCCQGIEAAHGFRGSTVRILHRDIKPENILIDEETGVARLGDFGISRIIDRTSAVVSYAGTPLYMDPECAANRATLQCDLYSLGMVIYEMLTGELPFHAYPRPAEPPALPSSYVPEIPPDLDAAVLRTLELSVPARYASAGELLADLRRIYSRLNPLPRRYQELSVIDDGRRLCDDQEREERVVVRLISTSASLSEFARLCDRLRRLEKPAIEIPLRQFENYQIAGVVSRPPTGSNLVEQFGKGRKVEDVGQLETLCSVVADACDLLHAMHQAGIRHGLVSPYSIVTSPSGTRLLEAGNEVALRANVLNKNTDGILDWLTPLQPYMSPQILRADHEPSAVDDVYSVGAVLFERLTGVPPLGEEVRAGLRQGHLFPEVPHDVRKLNRMVPMRLAKLIAHALTFNPLDRLADIGEFGEKLRAIQWPAETVQSLISDSLDLYPVGAGPSRLIEACNLLDEVLRLDPGNPAAHFARGVIYFRCGSFGYAVDELTKSARVSPDSEVYDLLGQAYERWDRQSDKAFECYRKSIGYRADPEVLERFACVQFAMGRATDAAMALKRSIELEPDKSIQERRRLLLAEWELM